MINQFLSDFDGLLSLIKTQKTYIRSRETKAKIIQLYESKWLPYSLDFKATYGDDEYSTIETALLNCYRRAKKDIIEKTKIIQELNKVETVLERIKLSNLRNYGFIIEKSRKNDVIDILKTKQFVGTLKYFSEAEKDHQSGKWKASCFNSRLALEEFFREFREKFQKCRISGGTVGEHIEILKGPLCIEQGELQLIKQGLYGFLSNKGGHATKDKPTEEDSRLSIILNYVFIEYFIEKFGKFLN